MEEVTGGEPDNGRRVDNLLFIHSYINTIRELFEDYEDDEALCLLEKIEIERC